MASQTARSPIDEPIQHELPSLFSESTDLPKLLAQGAEGILFKSYFLDSSKPCAVKYRPIKTWRHPTLDARLTRHRILSEARILTKCRRDGISVPGVLALDWEGSTIQSASGQHKKTGGWMMVEWIDGLTVRRSLDAWLPKHDHVELEPKKNERVVPQRQPEVLNLVRRIGREIGRMHQAGVIHGDLTTSNLMVRQEVISTNGSMKREDGEAVKPPLSGGVVLVDFGLATQSSQDEDRAVDLYVLERAFGSTHPDTEDLFDTLLESYGQTFKAAKIALKRLEDVRMRGRKKSMLG